MDIKENTGILFNNKQWTEGSKQPRVRGEINVGGKIMEVAMWVKKSANGNTYYSLALKDAQDKEVEKQKEVHKAVDSAKPTNSYAELDDDIPFNL